MGKATSAARVVVIDEEHRLLRAITAWLEGLGYDVRAFADTGEALDSLRRRPADLVLAGARVRPMSGNELCAAIRGSDEPPAIVGLVRPSEGAHAHDPFDVTVERPCPRDVLLDTITSLAPARTPARTGTAT